MVHFNRIRTICLASIITLVISVLAVGTVLAHAEVNRADPEPDAVVSEPPTKVRIWFTEPIEAPPNALRVIGPDGQRVDRDDARVAPDNVMALEASIVARAQGTYTVQWRVVSVDNHPVSGAYQFSVGAPSSSGASPVPLDAPSPVPWQAAGRWLHVLGLVIAIGPLIFGLLVLDRQFTHALSHRLWSVSRWGIVLLILTAPVMLLAQAIGIGGSVVDAGRADILRSALQSRWGVLWSIRLGLAIVLLIIASLAIRRSGKVPLPGIWSILGLLFGVPLMIATSLNGHPASTEPIWLTVLLDTVHLLATVAWIGGLLAFGLVVLPSLRAQSASDQLLVLQRAVPRFSTVALVCVELLVLTGLYSTWAQVGQPAALATTTYGQTLLFKLGLVVVAIGLGAVHLLYVRPRFARLAPDTPRVNQEVGSIAGRFGRFVGAELLVSIAILATVGVLTSLAPARNAVVVGEQSPAPSPPAVILAQNAGTTLVNLGIDPAGLGPNQLTVTLRDLYGEPITDAGVRIRTRPLDQTGAASSVTTMRMEHDAYRATVSLAPVGRWHLEVLITLPGETEVGAPFDLTVPVLGTKEVLVMADETMNRLQSLVEYNELTDGRAVVATHFEYQAPNRMHYRVKSPAFDGETYAIGTTRYSREQDGPWQAEPWPTRDGYQWPRYQFAEGATEVMLLGRETIEETECYVVSFYLPRTDTRYRMWIGTTDYRIYKYIMMAPTHYMTSTFTDFDAPLRIEPPPGVQSLVPDA